MPALATRAKKVLKKMWDRKTDPLLRALGAKRKGRAPTFSRSYREKEIQRLETLVSDIHRRRLADWVNQHTVTRSVKFGKGTTKKSKWRVVRDRLASHAKRKNLVYTTWTKTKCLKVGRSEVGIKRLVGQKNAHYFRDASRIKVYYPAEDRKRSIPKLECALTHLYDPCHMGASPAKKKYRTQCEVCRTQKKVKKQIRAMFPLRGR